MHVRLQLRVAIIKTNNGITYVPSSIRPRILCLAAREPDLFMCLLYLALVTCSSIPTWYIGTVAVNVLLGAGRLWLESGQVTSFDRLKSGLHAAF